MNLEKKLSLEELITNRSKIQKVFFYRICGTGMAAAACLLKEYGLDVEGADSVFYPPMSDYIRQTGIPVREIKDVTRDYLRTFDLIVVGNVVGRTSADAAAIEESGVAFASFPAAMGALVLKDKKVVGIAGTHGKTTTTYLFTQVFEKLGTNPGHFIGGVMEDRAPAVLGKGDYFFIESDEYDSAYFEKYSKFRSYQIDHLILTSLEFDHGDIFNSLEDIKNEFRFLLKELKGHSLFNNSYVAINELLAEFSSSFKYELYGSDSNAAYKIIKHATDHTIFSLKVLGKEETFKTNIVGGHNILNLSSVILFAASEGFSLAKIKEAILELNMVKRRQEIKGSFNKAIVVDDFAHHPRAVTLTIEALRDRFPKHKVSVVFEPASATARSDIFETEFAEAFATADETYILPPATKTTVVGRNTFDPLRVQNIIRDKKRICEIVTSLDDLIQTFKQASVKDSVFIVMSNGKCLGLWESDFVKNLS